MAQGDVALLDEPVAQDPLNSTQPARLGYTWRDGSPRVVAMWFHWDGSRLVMGTPVRAPKLRVLGERSRVAVTIDDAHAFPYRELTIRGEAEVEVLDDVVPEYVEAARRYFGPAGAEQWIGPLRGQPMARVAVTPVWVGLLDFESRFPSALS